MSDEAEAEEGQFEMVMPIVLAKSNGGPYDDAAVVAGMTCGALEQELKMAAALNTLPHERYIDAPLIKQADLIAMRHGYVLKQTAVSVVVVEPGEVDEASGGQHVAFDWA